MCRMLLGCVLVVGLWPIVGSAASADNGPSTEPPKMPEVMVCYFHRTVRCPTCQKIGELIERAVANRLAKEVEAGRVKVVMVDFQATANAEQVAAYKITRPTMLMLRIKDGKSVEAKPAPRIWALFRDEAAFATYVEQEVRAGLAQK